MTDPTPLNAAELAAVRARCEAATPGPWHSAGSFVRDGNDHDVARMEWEFAWKRHADEVWTAEEQEAGRKRREKAEVIGSADFIAHARTDIPRLLKTIEALETQRDGLLAALRFIHEHISDPERGFRDLYPAFGLDARRAVEMTAAAIDAAGDHACHPGKHCACCDGECSKGDA